MEISVRDAQPKKNRLLRLALYLLLAFPIAFGIAMVRIHTTVEVTSQFGTGVTICGNAGVYKAVVVRDTGFSSVTIKAPDGEWMLLSDIPEDLAARYDWLSDLYKPIRSKDKKTPAADVPERLYSWNPMTGPHFRYDRAGHLTEARFAGNVAFSLDGSEFLTLPAGMSQVESIVGSPVRRICSLGPAGAESP